jgi:hypothetical protein
MAIVSAVTWFPRTYLNLFETYAGLGKTRLNIKDERYDNETVTFTINDYGDYPEIRFKQEWDGIHRLTTDFIDSSITGKAERFMGHMQTLLVENILKNCHTITHNQIIKDIMPLNLNLIVLTMDEPDISGFKTITTPSLKIAYKPQESYYSGGITYVIGAEDESLLDILSYHAYEEVAFDFMYSLQNAGIRLYHEADNTEHEIEDSTDLKQTRKMTALMDDTMREARERYGKLRQALSIFDQRHAQFTSRKLSETEREISDALELNESMRRLKTDARYLDIMWSGILDKVQYKAHRMEFEILQKKKDKKGWLI